MTFNSSSIRIIIDELMKKIIFFLTIVLLTVSTINKSYANTIFYDDFSDTDGKLLEAHDYLWQPLVAEAEIENNKIQSIGGTNTVYIVPSLLNLTNYCVQADFNQPLPQTVPLDFFGLQTRQNNNMGGQYYEMQIGANENIYFYIFNNAEVGNYQLLFQQPVVITDGQHTAKLCSVGSSHSLYIDNNLIKTIQDSTYSSGAPGFTLGYSTPIDNFEVNTVVSQDLSVPAIKQTSDPWQAQEYDSAHIWNPSNPTINAWGCAMTSAAMIFRYYGINELPDGTVLDPGTLNTWLKNQPDGYVETGWVNWIALSRLSKLATSINHITSFDALEYQRTQGANTTQLTTDLNNSQPDILEEPGHFIVATGINGNTFDVNDPYYSRSTLNDGYNNSFLSLGQYIPARTDLSYIMLVTDPKTTLTVTNKNGTSVGSSFIQSPIINPLNSSQKNSSIKIYYLPKPDNGNYTVSATNANNLIKITSYLYDQQGNPEIQQLSGFTNVSITLKFNKSNSSNSSSKKIVTFDSTIQDIKTAGNLHSINAALAASLIAIVQNAKTQSSKHKDITKALLNSGIKLLNDSKNYPILISQDTYSLLSNDFNTLINSL